MTNALRSIRPDDYEVRYNSRTVGRILRLDEAKAAFRAALGA